MGRLSRVFGLILLGIAAWDSNVYYFHAPLPSAFFWFGALPVALAVYLLAGSLLLLGVVEVRRRSSKARAQT